MSRLRIRSASLLAALLLALAMAGALAASAVTAQPARAAGFGVCSILQNGQTRWDGNRLYQCKYIRGVGWLWIYVGTFGGCAATRLTTAC